MLIKIIIEKVCNIITNIIFRNQKGFYYDNVKINTVNELTWK